MRVLVTGGRDYNNAKHVSQTLDGIDAEHRIDIIIEGGATGADRLADEWAIMRRRARIRCKADWNSHGNAAGPIRNQQMLDEFAPDLVVAFPGGRGTADMIRRAEKAGVKIQRME